MNKFKRCIAAVAVSAALLGTLTGCAKWRRTLVDVKSNIGNGLQRTINVYTADGQLMATYSGKIDIESEASYVKFDFDGKRYVYYNCFVETIADY